VAAGGGYHGGSGGVAGGRRLEKMEARRMWWAREARGVIANPRGALVKDGERQGGLSLVSSWATMAMVEFFLRRRKEKEEWHWGSYSRGEGLEAASPERRRATA
jgi:hypothetical protein